MKSDPDARDSLLAGSSGTETARHLGSAKRLAAEQGKFPLLPNREMNTGSKGPTHLPRAANGVFLPEANTCESPNAWEKKRRNWERGAGHDTECHGPGFGKEGNKREDVRVGIGVNEGTRTRTGSTAGGQLEKAD